MKIDLSGKTAVVTGSTAGIGFAVAKGLAESGATVIVNGRTQAAVDRTIGELTKAVRGAVVRGIAADLGTAEGCASALNSERSADILVNNVGIYGPRDFERTGESIEKVSVAFVKANRPSSIIQRAATPQEVASMVVYVCSTQASATTGAALRVDGGVIETIA